MKSANLKAKCDAIDRKKKTFNNRIRLKMLGNTCVIDPSRFSYQPFALSSTNQNRIYAIAHFSTETNESALREMCHPIEGDSQYNNKEDSDKERVPF